MSSACYNVLFYTLGGGLGHMTRMLAIIRAMPRPPVDCRVLVSSEHSHLAGPLFPCPVDVVPGQARISGHRYDSFFSEYFCRNTFCSILVDTFPMGLFGELEGVYRDIPRLLVARSLNWPEYSKRITPSSQNARVFPHKVLIIEPLSLEYHDVIQANSEITSLLSPIVLDYKKIVQHQNHAESQNNWLIIHSGDRKEQEILENRFNELIKIQGKADTGHCETLFPNQAIFPGTDRLIHAPNIISGAGYNMIAYAHVMRYRRNYHFFPFNRKFDDQATRLALFRGKRWLPNRDDGAAQAAQWLEDNL